MLASFCAIQLSGGNRVVIPLACLVVAASVGAVATMAIQALALQAPRHSPATEEVEDSSHRSNVGRAGRGDLAGGSPSVFKPKSDAQVPRRHGKEGKNGEDDGGEGSDGSEGSEGSDGSEGSEGSEEEEVVQKMVRRQRKHPSQKGTSEDHMTIFREDENAAPINVYEKMSAPVRQTTLSRKKVERKTMNEQLYESQQERSPSNDFRGHHISMNKVQRAVAKELMNSGKQRADPSMVKMTQ